LSEKGPVKNCETEKISVNKLTVRAISTVDVLNSCANAGNEGSRMLSGKKLINEMQVMRVNRDSF
jgi:hypothetical protein